MVTEIGKFLRVLRAEQGESAKDMAEKLQVSPSYLSAVELGRREVPLSWEQIITDAYSLNQQRQQSLNKAMQKSKTSIKFDLNEVDDRKKGLILSVAKEDLDDDTIEKLCQILKKNKGDK